ncbi:MAG: FliM/FliN family flagellar motor switch protein [Alphaproteobacteria bacterium]|nr:FliM/FliN family flagellar motor switch protein [Alphaproteobacteria bacterium]
MSMIQTKKIPSISKEFHLARNALLALKDSVILPFAGKAMTLTFLPDSIKVKPEVEIHASMNNVPFAIKLQSFFFADYLKTKYPEATMTEIVSPVRNALLEVAFDEFLATLEQKFNQKIEIHHLQLTNTATSKPDDKAFIDPQNAFTFSFTLTDKQNQSTINGIFETDLSGLNALEALVNRSSPAGIASFKTNARIPLIMGQTRLSFDDLKGLEKEDVILCDKAFYRLNHEKIFGILPGLGSFLGKLSNQTLTIEKMFEKEISMGDEDDDFDLDEFLSDDFDDEDEDDLDEEETEDDQTLKPEDQEILDHLDEEEPEEALAPQTPPAMPPMPAAAPVATAKKAKSEPNATNFAALPVKMVFELASLNMPFDQTQKITEGYQINIGIDLNSPITIKANGKSIGKGQLVQIEKQIGIQVTELWK